MTDGDVDAARAEEVGRRGALEIASGDGDSLSGQDLSEPAHADSADADEMNAFNST